MSLQTLAERVADIRREVSRIIENGADEHDEDLLISARVFLLEAENELEQLRTV